MESPPRSLRRLDTLPDDMLCLIVSKVGVVSSTDYYNTIHTCKDLYFNFNDPFVAKNLKLDRLVKKPLLANKYKSLMERYLSANNLDAQYIKVVLEYFYCQNIFLGLHHLRLAAKGYHKEGRYLYGVVLMALGLTKKGKKVITKMTNREGVSIIESSWENIQISLTQIRLSMKKVYVKSLENMKPQINCHLLEINTVCSKCFHFYLMSEFVEMMIGLNPTPGVSTSNA